MMHVVISRITTHRTIKEWIANKLVKWNNKIIKKIIINSKEGKKGKKGI